MNRLAAIGVVTFVALVFGLIAAIFTHGADPAGWNSETAATRILATLANNPPGCQGGATPADAQGFDSPIHAQIADQHHQPCRVLIGSSFINGLAEEAPIQDAQGHKTGYFLQVQVDKPQTPPSWLTPFLITFIATLGGGLAMLLLWPRPAAATARRHTTRGQDGGAVPQQPYRPTEPQRPDLAGVGAANPSPPVVTPPKPPPPKSPARPVELAALTTSGVSGLTVDRGSSGPFEVYAATQVGLQHAKDGHTREDSYAVGGAPERGWVFLAVADGLGSAEDSHAAAQLAAQSAVKLMRQHVSTLPPPRVRDEWNALSSNITAGIAASLDDRSIKQVAQQLGYESRGPEHAKRSAPACTLVFAALGPVSNEGYLLVWGAVGDTELILVDLDSGQQRWITNNPTKQPGGMVSNVTHAMPRDYQQLHSDTQFVAANTMTVLASDGMADAIRQEPNQYATLLPQVTGPSPREWMFGELVGFDLPGLHDDRTIVAAWLRRHA